MRIHDPKTFDGKKLLNEDDLTLLNDSLSDVRNDLSLHANNNDIHLTREQAKSIDKVSGLESHIDDVEDAVESLQTELESHTSNNSVHVTSDEKSKIAEIDSIKSRLSDVESGAIELDDTVSADSENGVKSSGIHAFVTNSIGTINTKLDEVEGQLYDNEHRSKLDALYPMCTQIGVYGADYTKPPTTQAVYDFVTSQESPQIQAALSAVMTQLMRHATNLEVPINQLPESLPDDLKHVTLKQIEDIASLTISSGIETSDTSVPGGAEAIIFNREKIRSISSFNRVEIPISSFNNDSFKTYVQLGVVRADTKELTSKLEVVSTNSQIITPNTVASFNFENDINLERLLGENESLILFFISDKENTVKNTSEGEINGKLPDNKCSLYATSEDGDCQVFFNKWLEGKYQVKVRLLKDRNAVEFLKECVNELKVEVGANESRIDSLESTAEDYGDRIVELENKINPLEGIDTRVDQLETNKADKSELEGYATKVYVDEEIKKIDIPELPKNIVTEDMLSDYAKQSDISEFVTSNDVNGIIEASLIDYVTSDEANEIVSESLTGYVKTADIANFITEEALEGYAKTEDIPDTSSFITSAALTDYAKKSDIPSIEGLATKEEIANFITEDSLIGYAKTSEVESFVSDEIGKIEIPDVSGLATKDEVKKHTDDTEIHVTKAWKESVVTNESLASTLGEYTKNEDLQDFVTSSSLSDTLNGYVTNEELNSKVESVVAESAENILNEKLDEKLGDKVSEQVNDKIEELKEQFVTDEDISGLQKTVESATSKVGELESTVGGIQSDIAGIGDTYATKEEIKEFITDEALEPYATIEQLEEHTQSTELHLTESQRIDIAKISGIESTISGLDELFDAKVDKTTLSSLATKEDIADFVSSSDLEDKLDGYITDEEIQNYATKNELNGVSESVSNLEGIVASKVDQSSLDGILEPYAKSADVEKTYATKESLNEYVTNTSFETELNKKADASELSSHISDSNVHITNEWRNSINTDISSLKGEDLKIGANLSSHIIDSTVHFSEGQKTKYEEFFGEVNIGDDENEYTLKSIVDDIANLKAGGSDEITIDQDWDYETSQYSENAQSGKAVAKAVMDILEDVVTDDDFAQWVEEHEDEVNELESNVTDLQLKVNNIESDYLTSSSLNDYAKKSDLESVKVELDSDVTESSSNGVKSSGIYNFVTEQISYIEIPSIDGLATEEYVDEKVSEIVIPQLTTEVEEEDATKAVTGKAVADYVSQNKFELPDEITAKLFSTTNAKNFNLKLDSDANFGIKLAGDYSTSLGYITNQGIILLGSNANLSTLYNDYGTTLLGGNANISTFYGGNLIAGSGANITVQDGANYFSLGNALLGIRSTISGQKIEGNLIAGADFSFGLDVKTTGGTFIISGALDSEAESIQNRQGLILLYNSDNYSVYWPNSSIRPAQIHGWTQWANDHNIKDASGNLVVENGLFVGSNGVEITLEDTVSQSSENAVKSKGIFDFVVNKVNDHANDTTKHFSSGEHATVTSLIDDWEYSGTYNTIQKIAVEVDSLESRTSSLEDTADELDDKFAEKADKSSLNDYATKLEFNNHIGDYDTHFAVGEKSELYDDIDNKADKSELTTHTSNNSVHFSSDDRSKFNTIVTDYDGATSIKSLSDKVAALEGKEDIVIDATVTDNGKNAVTSKGIYDYIESRIHRFRFATKEEIDAEYFVGSDIVDAPFRNVVLPALDIGNWIEDNYLQKQIAESTYAKKSDIPSITIDKTVTAGSGNAVSGNAVYNYVSNHANNKTIHLTDKDRTNFDALVADYDKSYSVKDLKDKIDSIEIDDSVQSDSNNAVSGKAVATYISQQNHIESLNAKEIRIYTETDSAPPLEEREDGVLYLCKTTVETKDYSSDIEELKQQIQTLTAQLANYATTSYVDDNFVKGKVVASDDSMEDRGEDYTYIVKVDE